MADSMSGPWIRDYFMDVAETFGAQFYNVPASLSKKKVQLTEFLTYQEDSYVWAWMSDKDHRVSVRISKDAVESYKSLQRLSILDCRFSIVFISSYRPMFSPRPLRPNTSGNTSTSHISLEIGHVKLAGVGGHLFGNPRDLESDENMKEWVLGLRQDGGGGNVLKLRKQEKLEQNKKAPSSPPPFSLYAPVSQCHTNKPAGDTAKPKPERPQDLKRAYTKRWQIIEIDGWILRDKPDAVDSEYPDPCPPSSHRTPPRTSGLQQQGTPTDWSPSNRGSPVVPDTVTKSPSQQHDGPAVLPTSSNLPSDIETTSDTRSLQPPTPAQRIKPLPPPPSPSRSSPDGLSRHSPFPSQQLPCSFPPPPGSSLPPPFSSPPSPMSIRKNIQRKVPHPGLPVPRPDPTKLGPVQILVPNSDTSGTGSSQSYSQSQHQLLSHSPAFSLPLTKDFEPPDASTPRETKPCPLTRRMSKMSAESSPAHCDIAGNGIISTVDQRGMENANTNMGKQEALESTRPPAPSLPRIEVLEVGTSEPEEDQLEWTQKTARSEVASNTHAGTQGMGEGDAENEDNQLSLDKDHLPQKSPPRPCLPAPSLVQHASSNEQGTAGVSISLVRPESQSSMHSLFSDSLEDERTASSHTPVAVGQTGVRVQKKASPTHVPKHDPETWKNPSFLTMNKGKGKARAVEEPDTPSVKVGKKRRYSDQSETPVPKRLKVAASEVHHTASGQADTESIQLPVIEASSIGKIHSSNRVSAAPTDATDAASSSTVVQSSKPRLVNFTVDFERVNLGGSVPTPLVDFNKDVKATLLRTGRIRTLGKNVEEGGKVYIMR